MTEIVVAHEVRDYVRTLAIGSTFTSEDIIAALPHLTTDEQRHAVSSALTNLHKSARVLEVVGKRGRLIVYQLIKPIREKPRKHSTPREPMPLEQAAGVVATVINGAKNPVPPPDDELEVALSTIRGLVETARTRALREATPDELLDALIAAKRAASPS